MGILPEIHTIIIMQLGAGNTWAALIIHITLRTKAPKNKKGPKENAWQVQTNGH